MAVSFTRSTGSGGVMAVTLELDLYAGSPVDDTSWLDGGAAASSYPGSLAGFQAKNSNTTNATAGMKLIMGTFTLVQDNNEFTVGGDASKILAIVVGGSGVAGKSLTVDAGIGTATITMQAEGTLDSQTHFMAIVA